MAAILRKGTAPLMRGREGTLLGGIVNSSVSFTVCAIGSVVNMASIRSGEI